MFDKVKIFEKNLKELKDCLKDGNFDIAKEKMSLLKGTIERHGDDPEYAYSEEEKDNSFQVKQEDW